MPALDKNGIVNVTDNDNLNAAVGASDSNALLYCSFCGDSSKEVRAMIAGPDVRICDRCVGICNEALAEHERKDK